MTQPLQSGTICQRQENHWSSSVELLMLVNCSSTTHAQQKTKNLSELKYVLLGEKVKQEQTRTFSGQPVC